MTGTGRAIGARVGAMFVGGAGAYWKRVDSAIIRITRTVSRSD